MHSSPLVAHLGLHKTYACERNSFFWEGMKKDILTFVVGCDICQKNKGETIKTPGALQPFPL